MRRTYLFCDNCGVGHAHLLPRPGEDKKMTIANHWSWDKHQYVKLMKVLCDSCRKRKNKL